jgi:iron-sulfur cluster repair protein YtfE (RIC family)
MSADVPAFLRIEHEAFRATLKRAMREPGALSAAAAELASLADAHFVREEEFVLPLLVLLPALVRGEALVSANAAARMVQALRDEIDALTDEHHQIGHALRELAQAAGAEKPDYVAFAEDMILHMRREEQVLYPAAIVAGEYLRTLWASAPA